MINYESVMVTSGSCELRTIAAISAISADTQTNSQEARRPEIRFFVRKLMQSTKVEGLWQLLCPYLLTKAPTARHHPFPAPVSTRAKKTRSLGTSSYQVKSAPTHPWPHQLCMISHQTKSFGSVSCQNNIQRCYSKGHVGHPRRVSRQAEIDALYEELHASNKRGKYEWTISNIRKLVEDHHQRPSIPLYVALILSNTDPKKGSASAIEEILEEMGNEGIVPDPAIYSAILKVLSVHPNYLLRAEILEAMRQRWITLTDDGWHDLIIGLIRDRQIEFAVDTLRMLHDAGKKIESWLHDLLIYTLCDIDEFDEVLHLMRYREDAGEGEISPALWSHILDTASQILHQEATTCVWRKQVEAGFLNPSLGVCLNVINTAARHGDSRIAFDVFRLLRGRKYAPQIYHYEALIESLVSGSSADLKQAAEVLSDMVSAGVPPTEGSTRPIYFFLKHYPKYFSDLVAILEELKAEKRPIPVPLVHLLLEAHISRNDLSAAVECYKTQITHFIPSGPTLQTILILLRCCHTARRKDVALFLAEELRRLKMKSTSEVFEHLILACVHGLPEAGERPEQGWDDAWRYFVEMHERGFSPSTGTLEALAVKGCEMEDDKVWRLVPERNKNPNENFEVELRIRRIIGRHEDQGGKLRKREPLEKMYADEAKKKAKEGWMMELSRRAANHFV